MTNVTDPGPARQSPVVRALPLAYVAVAALLAVILLPSALRPPPDQAQTSAELSPDAPPDDDPDAIISSLRAASSRAAGAGIGDQGGGQGGGLPPVETRPARGVCFGDPPRAIESLYAAPCAPAWQGDNGGATHINVTRDEVRIGVSHVIANGTVGRVPDSPRENEGAEDRTLRVMQKFFNKNFEFYGRKFQIYQVPASSADPSTQNVHSVQAAEEFKLFGSYYLYNGFCEDFARRKLLMVCNPMPETFHRKWAPYVWAWMMDYSKVDRMGAEYVCKKLKDKNADFAGTGVQGTPRKFGLLFQTAPARNAGRDSRYLTEQLERQCGIPASDLERFDIEGNDGDTDKWAEATTRLRASGVTSVILQTEFVPAVQILSAADGLGWYPEWLLFFPYGLDVNIIGLLMPQEQMAHAFGLSAWEMPTRDSNTDCWRAHKSIEPTSNPSAGSCFNFFAPLLMFANGIQEAGPKLTPETFRDAQFSIGHRFYPQPWAIGGGYGPDDYTYMDNMGEIWWDSTATQPETQATGAYRWVRNGKRYREGEQPTEDPLVFSDGVSTRPG